MEFILTQNEIKFDNVRDFQMKYDERIEKLSEDVTLDFININYIDSSAIGALLLLHNRVEAKGHKLYLKNLSKIMLSVFKLGGLGAVLNVI